MVKVSLFEGMGRGIQAIETICTGTVVMACELLVLDPTDTLVVNSTELQHYTFKYNETQDCLVLGLGEIFNHSDAPNVKYHLQTVDGRTMMVFTALKPILKSEQLFIDYAADMSVDVSEYVNSKSMIG